MKRNHTKIRKSLAVFILSTALFVQCDDSTPPVPQEQFIVTDRDKIVSDLAIKMATAIKDKDTRKFLKTNLTSKFDGDYNFLLHEHLNDPISISNAGRVATFSDKLFGKVQ